MDKNLKSEIKNVMRDFNKVLISLLTKLIEKL